MAISIEFKDKYVYFGPEAGLHTQGEARAEVYDVTDDLACARFPSGLYDDH